MTNPPAPDPNPAPGPNQPPAPGGSQGQATPAAAPPKALGTAVTLMWVGCALALIGIASTLLAGSTVGSAADEALRGAAGERSPEQLETLRGAAVGLSVVTVVAAGLVVAGLWAWMAWKNRQGRSWARMLATVFGAIGIASGLVGLVGATKTAPMNLVLNLLNLLVAAGALYFLWRKENNPYYAAMSAPRA